ncbi:MAG: DUF58 domain-containing protein [Acidimicrobiales bacterium]
MRAATAGLLLAVLGALLRRPDAIVLAAPLMVVAAWGAWRRPTSDPVVVQSIDHATLREGDGTTWRVRVRCDDGAAADDLGVVLWEPGHAELDPLWGEMSRGMGEPDAGGHTTAEVPVALRSTRWGRRFVGPARVVASSPWAAFRWTSTETTGRLLTTVPLPAVFDAHAPASHAAGLVGLDRSSRPGDGSEFHGIRPFQTGDRLRRIHWARSLRAGTLHVTSTWADHDRHVVLLVDAHHDVGESDGIDGRASSLDTTVRAAGALAEHHLRRGDRVSVHVTGARGDLRVPPATGLRHLRRVLDVLAMIEPATDLRAGARATPGLTDGSLVLVLSPLVAPDALWRVVDLAARGFVVVVVDTLPDGIVDDDPDDPFRSLAWRIRLLERARELRAVQSAGVPVVRWRGPGSLDQVLRDLARRRSAPRMVRR